MTVTQLAREPASAAIARRQVRTLIRAWRLGVDPDIAVLLTSDLVTTIIGAGAGRTIALAASCSRGLLRIGASDSSWIPPATPRVTVPGPGLALVATLSANWGFYQTSAGPAAYFTLSGQPSLDLTGSWPARQPARPQEAGGQPAQRGEAAAVG